jgi:hypothetical protein
MQCAIPVGAYTALETTGEQSGARVVGTPGGVKTREGSTSRLDPSTTLERRQNG